MWSETRLNAKEAEQVLQEALREVRVDTDMLANSLEIQPDVWGDMRYAWRAEMRFAP
jgi:hypothetical protein